MKVLVVEDDVRMAGLLRRGLRQEGWAVDVVREAIDARHAVESTPYDAVVCDVGLPGLESGLDWCRWLRGEGIWTPVLMLTARTDLADRLPAWTVAPTTTSASRSPSTSWRPGCERCSGAARRSDRPCSATAIWSSTPPPTTRGGQEQAVELSPREFALLDYFMRRPGDVLRRSEILDHVWEYAYDGTSNVVDVYVRYLRAKLAAAGAPS